MKAAPSSEMNSRSPRVVAMRKTPTRSVSGRRMASTVMTRSRLAMPAKKSPVCQVQAIQVRSGMGFSLSDAAQGEALGDVVAHEPDHEGPRHDGEHARRREQAPVHAGGRDR